MDYSRIYNELISKAKNRQGILTKKEIFLLMGQSEIHHVVPECFYMLRKRKGPAGWLPGDCNHKSNLVHLTPEEHYTAHLLLTKIYPDKLALFRAVILMTGRNERYTNNKAYGWIRRKNKELSTGAGNPLWGKTASEETRQKQSKKKKRQVSVNGVIYESLRSAALELGFGTNYNRVTNRCMSDNYPEWKFVDETVRAKQIRKGTARGPMSEETKDKMRRSKEEIAVVPWNKGIKTGVATGGCFKKGNEPWNKGLKMKKNDTTLAEVTEISHLFR